MRPYNILGVFIFLGGDIIKIPLRYQMTKVDCGPTTFTNAISYLFGIEEIPAEILKAIYQYTLDMYGKSGKASGTSRQATSHLSYWFNEFSSKHKFKLKSEWFGGTEIDINFLKKELTNNSVIVLRVWSVYEHYVLITKIEDNYAYLFDPYYEPAKAYKNDPEIEVIENNNSYNRKVNIERLELIDNKKDYAMGEKINRECVIMRRI